MIFTDMALLCFMQTAREMKLDYTYVNRFVNYIQQMGFEPHEVFARKMEFDSSYSGFIEAAEKRIREFCIRTLEFSGRKIELVSTENPMYPANLKNRLGEKTPPCFFAVGNLALGGKPSVAVTGVRDVFHDDEVFARRMGELCARDGLVVVSGGASGVDWITLSSALNHGGEAVVYLPQGFEKSQFVQKNRHFLERGTLLCLSLWEPYAGFSGNNALERNVYIHSHGDITVTVRAKYKSGGSWSGACYNLERGRTPAYVSDIPSPGNEALRKMGAGLIKRAELLHPDFRLKEEITELKGFCINPLCEI